MLAVASPMAVGDLRAKSLVRGAGRGRARSPSEPFTRDYD